MKRKHSHATKQEIVDWKLKIPTRRDIKRAEKLGEKKMHAWLDVPLKADYNPFVYLSGRKPNEKGRRTGWEG